MTHSKEQASVMKRLDEIVRVLEELVKVCDAGDSKEFGAKIGFVASEAREALWLYRLSAGAAVKPSQIFEEKAK